MLKDGLKCMAWLAAILLCASLWNTSAAYAVAPPGSINLNSSQCPSLITQGEHDGCVTELQGLLNQHGRSIIIDGAFGPSTYAAVRVFQSQTGIAVDGIVGPKTKNALYNSSSSLPGPVNLLSASCPDIISQGASGGCVTELQGLLNEHGAHLVIDASFGPATLTAVRSFQSGAGLTSDGVVGLNTKDALYNGTGNPQSGVDLRSPSCPTYLHQGLADGCVITLQSLLNAHGVSIAVDGDFGPNTFAAVKSFQASAGLSVDGIVGPDTKTALYNNVGAGVPGAPGPINLTSGACPTNMSQGERDGCVTELQSLLNEHGGGLALDGIFGPATFAAVKSFQSDANLPIDGIAGPQTKNALYSGTIVLVACNIPAGTTSCATGDNVASRAVAVMHYLYDAPTSANQAQDQVKVLARYGLKPGLGSIPYVWGGGHGPSPGPGIGTCSNYTGAISPCPANHTVGLDCSALVRWLYRLAGGIDIGGSTYDQVGNSHLHRTTAGALVPGDLIFWGPSIPAAEHVAMYMGNNQYVVSTDNPAHPLQPYSPARSGTGPAVFEAWFTGAKVGPHLLSWHSADPVGYFHVTN